MKYSVFDTLLDGVLVLDSKGKVVYCNEAARTLLGDTFDKLRKDAVLAELISTDDKTLVEFLKKPTASSDEPTPYREVSLRTSEDKLIRVQISAQAHTGLSIPEKRSIIFLRDVTLEESLHRKYRAEIEKKERVIRELQEMQDQLVQFSKASVLGQFVASISHELNNPLTYVVSSAEELNKILSAETFDLEMAKKLTSFVYRGTERIMQISDHLKNFLHKPLGTENFVEADLHSAIDKAISFTHHFTTKSRITVLNKVPIDLPSTLMDPTLVEQVAINLIRNSADALLESGKGYKREIEITGKYREKTRSITIAFKDYGPGIPEETMKKLFTPFFTTKPIGKGTGLGLNICASIAERHGGTLSVRSTPEKGATFFLTIPVRKPGEEVASEGSSAALRYG